MINKSSINLMSIKALPQSLERQSKKNTCRHRKIIRAKTQVQPQAIIQSKLPPPPQLDQKLIPNPQFTDIKVNPSKDQVILKTLTKNNYKYFQQLATVCCNNKPKRNRLQLMQIGPKLTTYEKDFAFFERIDNSRIMIPSEERVKAPINKLTEYHNKFKKHQNQGYQKYGPQYRPIFDSPFIDATTYTTKFKGYPGNPAAIENPKNNILLAHGAKMINTSTYKKQFFEKEHSMERPLKSLSLFAPISGPHIKMTSTYNDQFIKKEIKRESEIRQDCRNLKAPFNRISFLTEYNQQFISKEHKKCMPKILQNLDSILS